LDDTRVGSAGSIGENTAVGAAVSARRWTTTPLLIAIGLLPLIHPSAPSPPETLLIAGSESPWSRTAADASRAYADR